MPPSRKPPPTESQRVHALSKKTLVDASTAAAAAAAAASATETAGGVSSRDGGSVGNGGRGGDGSGRNATAVANGKGPTQV